MHLPVNSKPLAQWEKQYHYCNPKEVDNCKINTSSMFGSPVFERTEKEISGMESLYIQHNEHCQVYYIEMSNKKEERNPAIG